MTGIDDENFIMRRIVAIGRNFKSTPFFIDTTIFTQNNTHYFLNFDQMGNKHGGNLQNLCG